MVLGLSLYPEQEEAEDIERYLETASKYGFTKVFTSLFSVKGTKEEIVTYFKNFTEIAHKYGMKVSGDCGGSFFEQMGASPEDLSVFREMGIDIIRMDQCFMDERDVRLINNEEGIAIEMSTSFVREINFALEHGANPANLSTCHNFYPQRYSAPSLESITSVNDYWRERGVKVAMFISSQEKGTHGPWPVSAGLPTIEEHRKLPIEVQLKHCMSLKNVDEVLIGNAYASEEEFKEIDRVMKLHEIDVAVPEKYGPFAVWLPHGHLTRIPFGIRLDAGITEQEKKILFDYPVHQDLGDCLNYMLRSRWTRLMYGKESIPVRTCEQTHFTRGDVVIVNDNCAHYRGEIQVVLKDMEADGERNLLGRIAENEIMILDQMGAKDCFTFYEV